MRILYVKVTKGRTIGLFSTSELAKEVVTVLNRHLCEKADPGTGSNVLTMFATNLQWLAANLKR